MVVGVLVVNEMVGVVVKEGQSPGCKQPHGGISMKAADYSGRRSIYMFLII